MTSEVFCGGLSGGVKNTVPAGRICGLVLLVAYSYSAMSDTMESGYIKISEPHHLGLLKMLSASVRDGHTRAGVETRAGHENSCLLYTSDAADEL